MQYFDFFHFIQVFKFKNKMQNSPKTPNTRKELTLEKKEVLNRITKGASYRKIQEQFGCSFGQISTIKKSKRKIDEAIKDNEQPDRTRLMVRKTANYDINVLMWKWFQEVRKRNIPLSGF